MSAINIACAPRHSAIFIVADAAIYIGGVITAFHSKIRNVPKWPGIVAGRGNCYTLDEIARDLSWRFECFDDAVAGIEGALPEIAAQYPFRENVELVICGWSRERSRPESYVIYTTSELPPGVTEKQCQQAETRPSTALTFLPSVGMAPFPEMDIVIAAGFEGVNIDLPASQIIAQMRMLIEIQRQMSFPNFGHRVGGFATLTTIKPDSIEESVLCHWPEDRVGSKIQPAPVDWARFRQSQLRLIA